jgi:hypothetical protein
LGRYIYGGDRWQTPLARELRVSRRLIGYWATGQRPVSKGQSVAIVRIAALVPLRRIALINTNHRTLAERLRASEHPALATLLEVSADRRGMTIREG